jgi:hypothetical protein
MLMLELIPTHLIRDAIVKHGLKADWMTCKNDIPFSLATIYAVDLSQGSRFKELKGIYTNCLGRSGKTELRCKLTS